MTVLWKRWNRRGNAIFCLAVVISAIAGCGVDWFPAQTKQGTTPDKFTFTNQTGVALSSTVTSNAITVAGLTAASSPISISGPVGSNSQYSINGGSYTSQAGTVKNDDTVTVQHTSASAVGLTVTSTLSIGGVTGTFSSTTQTVTLSAFTTRTPVGGLLFQTYAIITSLDTAPHTISIADTNGTALYSVGNANITPNTFFSTPETFTGLNGLPLFVRKEANTTTTVTIDGIAFPVVLPAQ